MTQDNNLEFRVIYKTYQPKIYRYLQGLMGEFEAEDLTQEVFVKVNQSLENFRGDCSLSTWIYKIATNTALDKKRSPYYRNIAQKKIIGSEELNNEDKNIWSEEKAPYIEQQLIRKEMNECIRNYIENLPNNYRTVILLSEYEGFKNQEIAEILGVTLDTVKIRLHRARSKLKKILNTQCNFYHNEQNVISCDQRKNVE